MVTRRGKEAGDHQLSYLKAGARRSVPVSYTHLDIFYVRVDRTRKVPVTVLVRALGYGTNAEIIDLFGEEPKLLASFGKDTAESYQDGLLELYRKIRPGEPLSVDSAESLLNSMFFDPRRYDLSLIHILIFVSWKKPPSARGKDLFLYTLSLLKC